MNFTVHELHLNFENCLKKNNIKRVKRQTPDCEKIVKIYTPDKGLISRIYKGLIQTKKKRQPDLEQLAKDYLTGTSQKCLQKWPNLIKKC